MKVDLLAEGGGQDRRKPSLGTLLGHCPSRPVVAPILPPKPAPGPLGRDPCCVVTGITRVKLSPTPTFLGHRGQSGIASNVTSLGANQGFTKKDPTY